MAHLRSVLSLVSLLAVLFPLASAQPPATPGERTGTFGSHLPLAFEPNRGQAGAETRYLARGPRYTLYLTDNEAVLALPHPTHSGAAPATSDVLRIQLIGATPKRRFEAQDRLPGISNYFSGREAKNWHTRIPNFARVSLRDVYPGVDLVYRGTQGQLEYDFRVSPGANPAKISFRIQGADSMSLAPNGDLVLKRGALEVRTQAPVVYQENAAGRVVRRGRFVIRADRSIGFELGPYDRSRLLVIDPILSYSTYLGGSYGGTDEFVATGSGGIGVTVDHSGSAYVVGRTFDVDFPTTSGALQTSCPLGTQICAVRPVLFVSKLNPEGTQLAYSSYLTSGYGTGFDVQSGNLIAVDASGNAHIGGTTFGGQDGEFPVTSTAFEQSCPFETDATCAFYTVLNSDGSQLVYSTYYGKAFPMILETTGTALALDDAGNAYLTGYTEAPDVPITAGAFQKSFAGGQYDSFVAKFNPHLSGDASLVYATYLGGNGDDQAAGIAVDASGNAYVTGTTTSTDFPHSRQFGSGPGASFLVKLSPGGRYLRYSDVLRGTVATSIALDKSRHAYLAGGALANSLALRGGALQRSFGGGAYDAFVAKFNPAGSALVYATYFGGNGDEFATGIALDQHRAVITGGTSSTNLPVTFSAPQHNLLGASDAFVAALSTVGHRLLFATYFGGSGPDSAAAVALDDDRAVYITGRTNSPDLPVTPGALQQTNRSTGGSAFVTKFEPFEAK